MQTMRNDRLVFEPEISLNQNSVKQTRNKKELFLYEIMNRDHRTAVIDSSGRARILSEQFMPYDLYLEEEEDIDSLINNLNNFYHWCASRVLSLDRKYAKEILNSIGASQAVTDKDRAFISLSYHCVSLTDVFWVKQPEEALSFADINLYNNSLNEAIVEISLRGRQMTVSNSELAPDLSTKGCFPKAWIRNSSGFKLLKDGGSETVFRELLASQICQCFDIRQVKYRSHFYDGQEVSESDLISSVEYSLVSKMSFDIYAQNHDLNTLEICQELDPVTYYGMNILDYLTGNTDRHPENWGFLIDNSNNQYVSLYPIMDFNQCFHSYDTLDGANCQTVYPRKLTQREAAVEAVKKIGLRQIRQIDLRLFKDHSSWAEMFERRLALLQNYCNETVKELP